MHETSNVHRFYSSPPTKEYLDKAKNVETLEEFRDNIRRNWVHYLLNYKENRWPTESYL